MPVFLLPVVFSTASRADQPDDDRLKVLSMGKLIFSDNRFSSSGKTSCKSCHRPEKSFSDVVPFSVRDNGTLTERSTPALYNMKQKVGYFSSEPVYTIESAVSRCFEEHLNVSVLDVYLTLKKDMTLSQLSTESFGRASAGSVYKAVAAYLESLNTSTSRLDRFRQGDLAALTAAEQSGLVLFEQQGCGYCHGGSELGGMVYSAPVNASPVSPDTIHSVTTARVQVPRLRNLSHTAPYFEDGSAATLQIALKRMSKLHSARSISDDQLELIRMFLLSHESTLSDFEGPVEYDFER